MNSLDLFSNVVSILPLVIIVLGLFGNCTCFLIFRLNRQFSKVPSMVFLSFVAIFDTLSLFEWNLNHFLGPNFGIRLEFQNLFNCKFFVFLQVYSLQVSALLLSIMCIDRYVTISSIPGSIYSRMPFSTVKNSTQTTSFNGSLQTSFRIIRRKEKCYWYTENFRFYPTIDHPVFKQNKEMFGEKKKFEPIMTLPSSIAFGFFSEKIRKNKGVNFVFSLLDTLAFMFHSTLFFNCFVTNAKFRQYCFESIGSTTYGNLV
ncbi:rhodopsin-like protein [Brachionus plicatilis]|uniref:Rhodopsin-like protein n=1 Tax=Brachionus plicatilis TaxID=10195 RepID=A0A3M7R340_BRAPC|nr:rhodopsin-like protein [Brachionus plicatilis]